MYAHLLIPFIDQLKQELEKKKKEENDPKSNLYYFKNCYNGWVLDQIKTTAHVKGPIFFVKNIILEFCDQTRIQLRDMLQLLGDKQYRNCKSHRIVEKHINEQHQENIIEYLQSKHSVEIIVDEYQEELLNKLPRTMITTVVTVKNRQYTVVYRSLWGVNRTFRSDRMKTVLCRILYG